MRIQQQNSSFGTAELFRATSGALSARVKTPDGRTVHLHSTVDPEAESSYFHELEPWGATIVFLGTGLGYHLDEFIDTIDSQTPVLAIECYQECLAHATQRLKRNTVEMQFLGGPDILDRAGNCVPVLDGPVQIIKHPASYACAPDFYDSILAGLVSRQSSRGLPRATHQAVVTVLDGSFFVQNELCRALERMENVSTRRFRYDRYSSGLAFDNAVRREIESSRPDCIVSINMKGFDGNGTLAETARLRGIPLAVWFVDDPRPILLNQKQYLTTAMTAFCWERRFLPFLKEQGFADAHYLPLAADMCPGDLPVVPANEHLPLTLVATTMGGSFLDEIRSKFLWRPEYESIVEQGAAWLFQNPERAADSFLNLLPAAATVLSPDTDHRCRTWLQSLIIHTVSLRKRIELVNSLDRAPLTVFGDSENWQRYCGSTLAVRPPVAYPGPARSLYAASTISLNTTSSQMPTAVNQRVFDVPASGGFLITDSQADIAELFDTDHEVVRYTSLDHLKELVTGYLSAPSDRQRITNAARARIQESHTYMHRARTLARHCIGDREFT